MNRILKNKDNSHKETILIQELIAKAIYIKKMYLKAKRFILNWKKVKMGMKKQFQWKNMFIAINAIGNLKIFSINFVGNVELQKIDY